MSGYSFSVSRPHQGVARIASAEQYAEFLCPAVSRCSRPSAVARTGWNCPYRKLRADPI
jgi:hypothetical protein